MNLIIVSNIGKLTPQFIDFILKYYRNQCYAVAARKHLIQRFDAYLEKSNILPGFTILQILHLAMTHLVCDQTDSTYTIHVDYNVRLPASNCSLYSTCKLMEFGNLEIQGLNIFSEAAKVVNSNLESLMEICQLQFPIVETEDGLV